MPSFAHRKITEHILSIDTLPTDGEALALRVTGRDHLQLLADNALSDELVIYASSPSSFVHSIAVPDAALAAATQEELHQWSSNPYDSHASYVSGGGRMWMEVGVGDRGCSALDQGTDLIFARNFDGWSGPERSYIEASQAYTHLAGIHWRSEQQAYCKYDGHGDLRHVISACHGSDEALSLVTFTRPELEHYLAIAQSSLVRMFEFTLVDMKTFVDWPEFEERIQISDDLFYRRRIGKTLGFLRGIQIVRPRVGEEEAADRIWRNWTDPGKRQYADFLAHDFRHQCLARISTDPKATANYFNMAENDLPHELSPVFFRPEVLSKYKADREKYTVSERTIGCRASWSLRGYDVNEAGQIHAYICDLRTLPHAEQLHWLSHNEEPKAGISTRAFTTDFEGQFTTFIHPREAIMARLRRWGQKHVDWWTLRDAALSDRANVPLSPSTEEWSTAFLDLSKLLVEGFQLKALRTHLDADGIAYDAKEQSIALLEKSLRDGDDAALPIRLDGLRTAQLIRSKVAGHSGGSEAREIAQQALKEHGSYAAHFNHVCGIIARELEQIEAVLAGS